MGYIAIYSLVGNLLLVFLFPVFVIFRICINKQYIDNLRQRLGNITKVGKILANKPIKIWVHAASVGEVQVAKIIIEKLSLYIPEAAFCLSTVTVHGQTAARQQLPNIPSFLAPLDIPWAVKRSLSAIKPTVYICLETELWPVLLHQIKKTGIVAILLNGRISQRSYKRYLLIRKILQDILSSFSAISTIGQEDAERFMHLGAAPEKIFINGNAKYDVEYNAAAFAVEGRCRRLLQINPEDKIFLCGSTRSGEEEALLPAFEVLSRQIPKLYWIIAPRHISRIQELAGMLEGKKLSYHRFSNLRAGEPRIHQIIIVDTIGDLRELYSIGTYIFIGGSLIDYGGHNMMEVAYWGKPVIYGPYTKDFNDAVALLENSGAGFRVQSIHELISLVLQFEHDPTYYQKVSLRAREVFAAQAGSSQRQIALILNILKKLPIVRTTQ